MVAREDENREARSREASASGTAVFVLTSGGVVLFAIGASAVGLSDDALGGNPLTKFLAPGDHERISEILAASGGGEADVVFIGFGGSRVRAWLELRPWEDGSTLRFVAVARGDPVAADAIPFARRYARLFDRSLAGIYLETLSGRLIACNQAYSEILGFESRDEALEQQRESPMVDSAERESLVAEVLKHGELTRVESTVKRKDGVPIWVIQNLTLLEERPGDPVIAGTMFDITEYKLAEERVAYHAYHDTLTGLPNPDLFTEEVEAAIATAGRAGFQLALMLLDLDQFKGVNDTRGHNVGDQVLQFVAYRLQKAIRQDDAIARFGGDEFMILANRLRSEADIESVAKKIMDVLASPFQIGGDAIYLSASIGIAMYPDNGSNYATLLRNADIAMYAAKEDGRNRWILASRMRSDLAVQRMTMEADLHRALDADEFSLYFQPQIESSSGKVVGVEALIRWNHPEHGLVMPNDFIPVAERSHLIGLIGRWVLREACRHAAGWQNHSPSLRVSVNLSPRQFQEPEFAGSVSQALEESGLNPDLLELEITEGAAMQNPEAALDTLRLLKTMGVRISIDDFGTGYSSLSYLSRFPIDSLKIDQGFVRDIEKEGTDSLIIAAVIALAHQLNLTVVAEGVETLRQSDFLKERSCEQMQGFFFSHALPADELDLLLREPRGEDS